MRSDPLRLPGPPRLRARALLPAALLLAACGRDLAVPAQQPPRLSSIQVVPPLGIAAAAVGAGKPLAAFSSERIELHGSALGSLATASLEVGGLQAALLSYATAPDGTQIVQAQLPALEAGPAVQVVLTTPAGSAAAPSPLVPLGPGRPRELVLRSRASLSPQVGHVGTLDELGFAIDFAHDLLIGLDVANGAWLPTAARLPQAASRILGASSGAPWVFDLGLAGQEASLHAYDFSRLPPLETCAATVPAGPTNPLVVQAAIAPSGGRIAVPTGGPSLLLQTAECTPARQTVAIGSTTVWLVAFGAEGTLVGFDETGPFRVELGAAPQVFAGAPYDPGDAGLDPTGNTPQPFVARPGARRAAFVRGDGNLGFVSWPEGSGPPVIDANVFTFARPIDLAWSADGSRLLMLDAVGLITVFDVAAGQPVASLQLAGATSLARLAAGPAAGDLFVGTGDGTALITPGAALLRERPLAAVLPSSGGLARGVEEGEEQLFCATNLDALQFGTGKLAVARSARPPLQLLGVASSGGLAAGWRNPVKDDGTHDAAQVWLRSAGAWTQLAVKPKGAVVALALDDAAGVLATLSLPDSGPPGALELFPLAGGAATAQQDHLALDGTRMLFRGGRLYVASGEPASFVLERFAPGGLSGVEQLPIGPAAGSARADAVRLSGLWESRALGGVLASAEIPEAGSGFYGPAAQGAATLWLDGGARADTLLGRALAVPVALSADGRELLAVSRGEGGSPPGVEAVELLGLTAEGGLALGAVRHQDQAAVVTEAIPSADGSRYYVSFAGADAVGVLE